MNWHFWKIIHIHTFSSNCFWIQR